MTRLRNNLKRSPRLTILGGVCIFFLLLPQGCNVIEPSSGGGSEWPNTFSGYTYSNGSPLPAAKVSVQSLKITPDGLISENVWMDTSNDSGSFNLITKPKSVSVFSLFSVSMDSSLAYLISPIFGNQEKNTIEELTFNLKLEKRLIISGEAYLPMMVEGGDAIFTIPGSDLDPVYSKTGRFRFEAAPKGKYTINMKWGSVNNLLTINLEDVSSEVTEITIPRFEPLLFPAQTKYNHKVFPGKGDQFQVIPPGTSGKGETYMVIDNAGELVQPDTNSVNADLVPATITVNEKGEIIALNFLEGKTIHLPEPLKSEKRMEEGAFIMLYIQTGNKILDWKLGEDLGLKPNPAFLKLMFEPPF